MTRVSLSEGSETTDPIKFGACAKIRAQHSAPLPMTAAEAGARGWGEVDVVLITGDAYVDHPSFAAAILGRVLEAEGFSVGIVAQPDWHSSRSFEVFGRPRLFFAVSAGNMDSMLNHYTAGRKVRNDDAFSPGGRIGLRPDRATLVYCQRARQACKGVPIVAGGVEASLRRLAHYDYWSDTVKRSILLDSKADLVIYGMGEAAIVEAARRLAGGESIRDLRDMRGAAYALGARDVSPTGADVVVLPSYEEVRSDKRKFAEATRRIHAETSPYNARTLVQWHDRQAVVCNPPRLPESQEAMDFFYDLPYTRRPHPGYTEPIPAYEMIKDSVTIMRGCFGGCTFCSLTAHQGRIIRSRSRQSILDEVAVLARNEDFAGVVSDIGGPTANMYAMGCTRPEIEALCRRQSCLHPKRCPLLRTDHRPLIAVLRGARGQTGVRKVLVASGVRMDLARLSPEYVAEVAAHHVGGHLKVAPEHCDSATLTMMRKPAIEEFQAFAKEFDAESHRAGREQYLVPYFISGHPGCDLKAAVDLAVFLKRNGYRPEQVQDFIPTPMDIATCMYHTGLDPMTMQPVYVPRRVSERRMQRALLQYFKPENYFLVRRALREAGRRDLIGGGPHCLIPAKPPRAALELRRRGPLDAHGESGASSGQQQSGGRRKRRPRSRSSVGYQPGRRGAGGASAGPNAE